MSQQSYTLTFCDVAENHVGMEKIGKIKNGLTYEEIIEIRQYFKELGAKTKMYNLHNLMDIEVENAYFLVIKDGINYLTNPNKLYNEQENLEKDKKALMKNKVVNKHARYNLCFSDFSQEPNYEEGKGRVINFADLKYTRRLRREIGNLLKSDKLKDLQCEGNYYYDIKKTYIGQHGDAERNIVVGCRMTNDENIIFPIQFQWFNRFKSVSELYEINLNHGDMYFMSDKVTGRDWKKSSLYTLRHSAGNTKLFKK